ncbi:putative DUF21 domain-containing protein, chloroplastic, partial [Tanacetum coccineum]
VDVKRSVEEVVVDDDDGLSTLKYTQHVPQSTLQLMGCKARHYLSTSLLTEAAIMVFGKASVSAATGVMTVVVILLTEIIPKSIAVHNAIAVARAVVHPVAWLSIVLYRVGRVVTFLSMGMLKILGLKAKRIRFSMHYQVVLGCSVPWSNERPLKNKELNAIIGVWFTLWRD